MSILAGDYVTCQSKEDCKNSSPDSTLCIGNRCLCHNNNLLKLDGTCAEPAINRTPSTSSVPTAPSDHITSAEIGPTAAPELTIYYGIIIILFILLVMGLLYVICIRYEFWSKFKESIGNKKKNLSPLITENPAYALSIPPSMRHLLHLVPSVDSSSITFLRKIGEGHFGEVHEGLLYSVDNKKEKHVQTVAIKMLKPMKEEFENFLKEAEIMSYFQHPNIITLLGICYQENSNPPWIIIEYMQFGDLAKVLRDSTHKFWKSVSNIPTTQVLLSISLQIAAGMKYLASQKFIHRDLACRNCLVGSALTVKISDFGMSRDVYTCDYYRMGGNKPLPIRWMPPESIQYGTFTLESDVWSYGVLLWEIYTNALQPYFGYTNEEAIQFILRGNLLDIPTNCPNEVAKIMRSCWEKNKKERIQFSDICNRLSTLKENIDQISTPADQLYLDHHQCQ